jgi:hypothetical protein
MNDEEQGKEEKVLSTPGRDADTDTDTEYRYKGPTYVIPPKSSR